MTTHPSSIVILTGAGISAESGVATFRDEGGIWSQVRIEDVATPQAFARGPDRVHAFYNARRAGLDRVAPNAAHLALARLEREFAGDFLLVTQNIDDLHERAGSQKLIHMHGELAKALCLNCGMRHHWREDMDVSTPCPSCSRDGFMRPDVVWFGEMPYQMETISDRLGAADLFVSIGTSGTVYPAAGFVEEARGAGALTVELNLEPSAGHSHFHRSQTGAASSLVSDFVENLLAGHVFNKD